MNIWRKWWVRAICIAVAIGVGIFSYFEITSPRVEAAYSYISIGIKAAPQDITKLPLVSSPTLKGTNLYQLPTISSETITVGQGTVGDFGTKADKIAPQIYATGFLGNSWFKLTPQITDSFTATTDSRDNSLTTSGGNYEIKVTPTPANPIYNEYGGFDYAITVLKPPFDHITFTFASDQFICYLQPPLTEEYKVGEDLGNKVTVKEVTDTDVIGDDGNVYVHRPVEVVDSIAIYSTTQGGAVTEGQVSNGITTGKLGQLYRMKATDSSNTPQKVYCDWSIDRDNLVLTPEKWADIPIYPITISPLGDTFGYTTAGGTHNDISGWSVYGFYPFAPALSGTLTHLSIYGYMSSDTHNVQLGLYTDAATATRRDYTGSGSATATPGWTTIAAIVGYSIVASTNYAICVNHDYYYNAYYDTATGYNNAYEAGVDFNTWPASITWDYRPNSTSRKYSAYGTFIPSGGTPDISESPITWLMNGITGSGKVQPNTTYYAKGGANETTAPSATVQQSECQFLITNSSTMATDLTVNISDFSGGSDNSTNGNTGSNGATSYGAYCWYSGEAYTSKGLMKSSGSTLGNLILNLGASTNLYWGAEVKTQSNAWTGGTSATSTITITATAH